MRKYNKIVDDVDVIGPTLMHTILKTTVYGIEELRAVKNTADQLKVFTGHGQTYDEYCTLLIYEATSYDDHHKPKSFLSRRNTNNRKVYEHDLSYNDIDSWGDHGEFEEFNVHTDVQEIQAYATNFQRSRENRNPSTFLPQSIYKDMDDQSRSAWTQINPNIRSKIVRSITTTNPQHHPTIKHFLKIANLVVVSIYMISPYTISW